ncbi:MAG: hypothetical protein ABIO70_35485 [Pseudomonadota bacterium]
MAQLGSVFPEEDRLRAKGADLHWAVQVPPAALGHAEGAWVRVPRELPGGGARHRRVEAPGEPGEKVLLRLPEGLPDGAVLRLRARGAAGEGQRPGDLLVRVEVREGPLNDTWLGLAEVGADIAVPGGGFGAALWIGVGLVLALFGLALLLAR